ncbi:MAG: GTPase domain-containing protein [Deltaproteobacteria bacterium]|uniref:GTPase domain-containing protein n=1 Tax=Candidatus Zymogenus saltonus TaxID=2844893 RepID=A0A9D8KE66_9DELT|nr:GTPase domain-containing protein [Candidatus Zymogenus saltonus]
MNNKVFEKKSIVPIVKEIRIIGPLHSGKMAILGSIEQAFLNWNKYESGVNIGFFPQNSNMENLCYQYKITIKKGELPKLNIDKITEYIFDLELRGSRLKWFLGKKMVRFRVLYFPGTLSFPSTAKNDHDWSKASGFSKELVDSLDNADGFIACLDANDNDAAFDFWANLPRILGKIENKPKKVVVCLNKSDKLFADREEKAYGSLLNESPLKYGKDFIPKSGLNCLDMYCKGVKLGICWSSVYGFLKTKGYANYNSNNDRLLLWGKEYNDQDVINNWMPYHVVEPFLFMVLGGVKGVKKYSVNSQQFKEWIMGKFSVFYRFLFRLKAVKAKG